MGSRYQPAWPFPGDAPVVVARKVALAYRGALERVAPSVASDLDARMAAMGQDWVRPRVLKFELDALVGRTDAADVASVPPKVIDQWRSRGRLLGQRDRHGVWKYRVSDILAVSKNVRIRGGEGTGEHG